jgi:hypothetical protein
VAERHAVISLKACAAISQLMYVMYVSSGFDSSTDAAVLAQGIHTKEPRAELLPVCIVAAARCASPPSFLGAGMLSTAPARRRNGGATRLKAAGFWRIWQSGTTHTFQCPNAPASHALLKRLLIAASHDAHGVSANAPQIHALDVTSPGSYYLDGLAEFADVIRRYVGAELAIHAMHGDFVWIRGVQTL